MALVRHTFVWLIYIPIFHKLLYILLVLFATGTEHEEPMLTLESALAPEANKFHGHDAEIKSTLIV